jgi:hypothetical protein
VTVARVARSVAAAQEGAGLDLIPVHVLLAPLLNLFGPFEVGQALQQRLKQDLCESWVLLSQYQNLSVGVTQEAHRGAFYK